MSVEGLTWLRASAVSFASVAAPLAPWLLPEERSVATVM